MDDVNGTDANNNCRMNWNVSHFKSVETWVNVLSCCGGANKERDAPNSKE
jgi:hypothetical protein